MERDSEVAGNPRAVLQFKNSWSGHGVGRSGRCWVRWKAWLVEHESIFKEDEVQIRNIVLSESAL